MSPVAWTRFSEAMATITTSLLQGSWNIQETLQTCDNQWLQSAMRNITPKTMQPDAGKKFSQSMAEALVQGTSWETFANKIIGPDNPTC